jgi:hypothetical protein
MGVNVSVRRPKGLDVGELLHRCTEVPIDCKVGQSWISFHFGYWGMDHIVDCTNFVKKFAKKHKAKIGKWSY